MPNIVALGAACQLSHQLTEVPRIRQLRDRFEDEVLARFDARLNGTSDRTKRLPNTSNISFRDKDGPTILARLDEAGICVSTGSACNAAMKEVSGVLRAMDVPYDLARGAIRFSLGRYNTEQEIEHTLDTLDQVMGKS